MKNSVFCPWWQSCQMASVGPVPTLPVTVLSALFPLAQVTAWVPCYSSPRPLCQEAAKHVLVCRLLQVEEGQKWQ